MLLDMVATVDPATPVIFLDTGKLFPETQAYREEMVELLGLRDVRVVRPQADALARHDRDGNLWSREPDLRCHIRKTEPLQDALEGFVVGVLLEQDEIGVVADMNFAATLEAEATRRQPRHLAHGLLQRHQLHVARVMTEHARERAP